MAWGTVVTSAELTCDANNDFLKASDGSILVATLNPRELVEVVWNLISAGTTDDLDIEILGGVRLSTGTAQSGGSTSTIVLASGETYADDELIGCFVFLSQGGDQEGEWGLITDYVSSTKVATVSTANGSGFTADPGAATANSYEIYKFAVIDSAQIDSAAIAVEQLHTLAMQVIGVPYVAFRAGATGATDAHKVRVSYQKDGVSA